MFARGENEVIVLENILANKDYEKQGGIKHRDIETEISKVSSDN